MFPFVLGFPPLLSPFVDSNHLRDMFFFPSNLPQVKNKREGELEIPLRFLEFSLTVAIVLFTYLVFSLSHQECIAHYLAVISVLELGYVKHLL